MGFVFKVYGLGGVVERGGWVRLENIFGTEPTVCVRERDSARERGRGGEIERGGDLDNIREVKPSV